jgi:hypothetical protein
MDYFPRVVIEGRVFESVLEAESNLTERFIWDRLDIYGRRVFGQVWKQLLRVRTRTDTQGPWNIERRFNFFRQYL